MPPPSPRPEPPTPADRELVAQRLGRPPAGRFRVARRDDAGRPVVIENHPILDDQGGQPQPFPTTHWLIDPGLVAAVGRLESAGAVAQLERRIQEDADLAARVAEDHRRLIAYRLSLLAEDHRNALAAAGRLGVLQQRGVAGIADFTRVKCLHAWLAHHLARGNALGPMIQAALTPEA